LLERIGTEYVTRYAKFRGFRWEELRDESEEQIRLIPLLKEKKGC
jgi:hypothetical protein